MEPIGNVFSVSVFTPNHVFRMLTLYMLVALVGALASGVHAADFRFTVYDPSGWYPPKFGTSSLASRELQIALPIIYDRAKVLEETQAQKPPNPG